MVFPLNVREGKSEQVMSIFFFEKNFRVLRIIGRKMNNFCCIAIEVNS